LRESFCRGDLPSRNSVRALLQQVFSKKVSGTGKGMKIEMGLRYISSENDIKVSPFAKPVCEQYLWPPSRAHKHSDVDQD
jgi:hypothetical protein